MLKFKKADENGMPRVTFKDSVRLMVLLCNRSCVLK